MDKHLNLETFKEAMMREGLNPARLAKELEVSREAVSKWLAGESLPRPDKLLKLALRLGVKFEQLLIRTADASTPVIAFRKKGNAKTTAKHITRAMEMGHLLRPLAPYLPFDQLVRPATLKQPVNDYGYLQKVTTKVREEIGVCAEERLDFNHLIKKFRELQAVLIPVLWGKKDRHENALHIFLPDSMTTWVYLNLDSEVHDFMFWMAHELGHILAPDLRGELAEDFADAFAGALLFPEPLAADAYRQLAGLTHKGKQMNRIKDIAADRLISPITVYLEVNHYATYNKLPKIDLGTAIFGAAQNLNKAYLTLSETLFDGETPEAQRYIGVTQDLFDSPFFAAVRSYVVVEHKGPGYLQSILDIPLLDAKALHSALA